MTSVKENVQLVKNTSKCEAEESVIRVGSENISCSAKFDIKLLNKRHSESCLTLSMQKSNVMLISSCQKLRNNDLHVTVGGKQLSRVSSSSILVSILMNILLGTNIQQVCFKGFTLGYIAYIVYALCLLPCFRNCSVFVLPILDYCDVVWTPSSVQHFKYLELLHSKFHCPSSRADPTVCLNTDVSIQQYKYVKYYIMYHHLIYIIHFTMLLISPDVPARIFTVYLFESVNNISKA